MTKFNSLARARVIGPEGGACGGGASGDAREGATGVDVLVVSSSRCKKLECEFVARTFTLIAPVQPVLHRVSCSNETIQNASKHYETHQNTSLGPNGVDRVHSLRKIPIRLRGKNFCINCTNSARFAQSFVQ